MTEDNDNPRPDENAEITPDEVVEEAALEETEEGVEEAPAAEENADAEADAEGEAAEAGGPGLLGRVKGGVAALMPGTVKGKIIAAAGLLLAVTGVGGTLYVLESAPAPDANAKTEEAVLAARKAEALDRAITEGREADVSAPAPDDALQDDDSTPRAALRQAEVAMQKGDHQRALRLLERALERCPSTEGVLRGRIFEALVRVNRDLGNMSLARIYDERAKELLTEISSAAHLLDAAESKLAVGEQRAAQRLYHRFLLLSGGLEDEGIALRVRAELGLADSYDAEWRTVVDRGALDVIPDPDFDFGGPR